MLQEKIKVLEEYKEQYGYAGRWWYLPIVNKLVKILDYKLNDDGVTFSMLLETDKGDIIVGYGVILIKKVFIYKYVPA